MLILVYWPECLAKSSVRIITERPVLSVLLYGRDTRTLLATGRTEIRSVIHINSQRPILGLRANPGELIWLHFGRAT